MHFHVSIGIFIDSILFWLLLNTKVFSFSFFLMSDGRNLRCFYGGIIIKLYFKLCLIPKVTYHMAVVCFKVHQENFCLEN